MKEAACNLSVCAWHNWHMQPGRGEGACYCVVLVAGCIDDTSRLYIRRKKLLSVFDEVAFRGTAISIPLIPFSFTPFLFPLPSFSFILLFPPLFSFRSIVLNFIFEEISSSKEIDRLFPRFKVSSIVSSIPPSSQVAKQRSNKFFHREVYSRWT